MCVRVYVIIRAIRARLTRLNILNVATQSKPSAPPALPSDGKLCHPWERQIRAGAIAC